MKRIIKDFKTNSLAYLLIGFSFFPYLQIFPLGSDSQPYALLLSFFLIYKYRRYKLDINQRNLGFVLIIAIICMLIPPLSLNSIRSLIGYLSLFCIPIATVHCLVRINGIPYKLFKYTVLIWFFTGFIQTFFFPNFLNFLIPRGDSSLTMESGRGVVCLAPEPTHYGLMCIFFLFIAYLNFRQESGIRKIYLCPFLQLLLFSRSSLALLICTVAVCSIFILKILQDKKNRIKYLMLFVIISILITIIYSKLSESVDGFRAGRLLALVLDDPSVFIMMDSSVNDRFIHFYFPFKGLIDNFFLPHGYNAFGEYINSVLRDPSYNRLIMDENMGNSITRIMSGWGGVFFEIGLFAIIIVKVLWRLVKYTTIGIPRKVIFITLILIFFNAFPFSTAIAPFLIGNMMYLNNNKIGYANTSHCKHYM